MWTSRVLLWDSSRYSAQVIKRWLTGARTRKRIQQRGKSIQNLSNKRAEINDQTSKENNQTLEELGRSKSKKDYTSQTDQKDRASQRKEKTRMTLGQSRWEKDQAHMGMSQIEDQSNQKYRTEDRTSFKKDPISYKQDLTSLKKNQTSPEMDQTRLKKDQNSLKENQTSLEKNRLKRDQSSQKKDQTSSKKDQEKKKGQPSLKRLTWYQIDHLKYLRNSQPGEWTITKLSRSFGISMIAVVRILQSKFDPPQEVKDRQDKKAKEQAKMRKEAFKEKLLQKANETSPEGTKAETFKSVNGGQSYSKGKN